MKIPSFSKLIILMLLTGCSTAPTHSNTKSTGKNITAFYVKPAIYARIYLVENTLTVRVNQQPPQTLPAIIPALYNEYSRYYVLHNDYNRDGFNDIAILGSLDIGASNPCYTRYHYNPTSMRFVRHTGAMLCNP